VPEETTPLSSRIWSPNGSTRNSNPIPQLTMKTNTVTDSSTMHVADCSARPKWTGMIQGKYYSEVLTWYWLSTSVRAGIRDRTDGHIVTEMSWPAFLYQGYTADANNLEQGLFKSKILIQVCPSQVAQWIPYLWLAGFQGHIHISLLCQGSGRRWWWH
jgi:hypothetical protein